MRFENGSKTCVVEAAALYSIFFYRIYNLLLFPVFSNRFPEKILKTNDFFHPMPDGPLYSFQKPNESVIYADKSTSPCDKQEETPCPAANVSVEPGKPPCRRDAPYAKELRTGTAGRVDPCFWSRRILHATAKAAPGGPPRRRCSGRNPRAGRGPDAKGRAPRGRSYRDRR